MGIKFLIIGRTASGKDALREILESTYGWTFVKSYTTRPKRFPKEDTHIFITKEEADAVPVREKAAWTKIGDFEYFATAEQIRESDGYIIDPHGAEMLTRNMPNTLFCIVAIVPVSSDLQKKAAIERVGSERRKQEQEEQIFHQRVLDEGEQFTRFEKKIGQMGVPSEIFFNDYKPQRMLQLAEELNEFKNLF